MEPAAPDAPLTEEETARVAPFVTTTDGPVFALVNLPEVVKAALFARYSRSPKSLRRLLVDEFLDGSGVPALPAGAGERRATELFERVFFEYGDDSVAQLGGAHIAVEGASNILTKILQWGRLASYLEQSTRYISFTDRPGGRYRYHRPPSLAAAPEISREYDETLDRAFAVYGEMIPQLVARLDASLARPGDVAEGAWDRTVRARALDGLRGLLPAATTANVGVFASGQAFEAMLVRMRVHPLPEARSCAAAMLEQLRVVIPDFLTRVDRPDRGDVHGAYLSRLERESAEIARELLPAPAPGADGPAVRLLDFDPDGEARVLAHSLWPASGLPLAEVLARCRELGANERATTLKRLVGERANRRHRPGRGFEATTYTFEITCDYGAYRDLQRHRMLSLQAQPLTPALGWEMPDDVAAAGLAEEYAAIQAASAELFRLLAECFPDEAAYAVSLAHRLRFTMVLNAREAMHIIELRSQPQGHASYRRVAQQMHDQIARIAGHQALADAMAFTDASSGDDGRLAAETRAQARRGSSA